MGLKIKVSNLEEVPEVLREFYVKQDDGTFILDGVEDTKGLKSALEKERESVHALKKELSDVKGKFGHVDPDEYLALKQEKEKGKKKQMLDEGKIDEIIQERVSKMQKEYEEKLQAGDQQIQQLRGRLHKELVDNNLTQAAVKLGVVESAVQDVQLRGRNIFQVQDDGSVIPKQDGKIVYGKDPSKPMTVEEWLTEQQKVAPHWFKSSQGAGSPSGGKSGMTNGKFVMSRETAKTDFQAYKQLEQQAREAGQTVQLVD